MMARAERAARGATKCNVTLRYTTTTTAYGTATGIVGNTVVPVNNQSVTVATCLLSNHSPICAVGAALGFRVVLALQVLRWVGFCKVFM